MVVRLFVTSEEVIKIVNDAYCCFVSDFFPLSFFCTHAGKFEDSISSLLMFKLHFDVAFLFFRVLAFSSKMRWLCKWWGHHLWQGGWCTVCKKSPDVWCNQPSYVPYSVKYKNRRWDKFVDNSVNALLWLWTVQSMLWLSVRSYYKYGFLIWWLHKLCCASKVTRLCSASCCFRQLMGPTAELSGSISCFDSSVAEKRKKEFSRQVAKCRIFVIVSNRDRDRDFSPSASSA